MRQKLSDEQRAGLVKIVQNVCSLIVEVGVAIKQNTIPETKGYTEALIDGIEEYSDK